MGRHMGNHMADDAWDAVVLSFSSWESPWPGQPLVRSLVLAAIDSRPLLMGQDGAIQTLVL